METIIAKVEKLEIDTSNIAKWSDSEETTKDPLTPVSIDLNSSHPAQNIPMTTSSIKQHKRSASAIYEYVIDSSYPCHQSSPDLKQKATINSTKKWFWRTQSWISGTSRTTATAPLQPGLVNKLDRSYNLMGE
ncbi:hypothetical protein G6F42_028450 [Rhizopus arrhizus]|nr:hypothetical protein G6F42_028450 [Rhizopus arrhizus]